MSCSTASWTTVGESSGYTFVSEQYNLSGYRLRLEPYDGSLAIDYRIENGHVEQREVAMAAKGAIEAQWQQLTSERLTSHVLANTVVAYWLARRLGLRALVRACNQHCSFASNDL